jgi:hypothetical protein
MAVPATVTPPFSAATSLAALLATESVLFAALNVGVGFSQRTAKGHRRWLSGRALALSSAGLITVVAIGAATAWWDEFGWPWQHGSAISIEAVCLLIAVVAQPLLAFAIASNVASDYRAYD